MTTITRHVQRLRPRVDAAAAVAMLFTMLCLIVAAGAFAAALADPVDQSAAPATVADEPPRSHRHGDE